MVYCGIFKREYKKYNEFGMVIEKTFNVFSFKYIEQNVLNIAIQIYFYFFK